MEIERGAPPPRLRRACTRRSSSSRAASRSSSSTTTAPARAAWPLEVQLVKYDSGDRGDDAPSRLARRLGLGDAVVIGLGSMIGAGVFAAFGPAAEAAGSGLLVGLAIAAFVAYCNATSSAELAALYPPPGGTYVYGRERLGPFWGYLAGWGFVVGKTASCAAHGAHRRRLRRARRGSGRSPSPPSSGSPPSTTSASARPPRSPGSSSPSCSPHSRSSSPARAFGGRASTAHFGDLAPDAAPTASSSPRGCCSSRSPATPASPPSARRSTTPPARSRRPSPARSGSRSPSTPLVAISALAAVGPAALARSDTPLATAVRAGHLDALVPAVRIGGAIAALGVLLSLIAGVSRTVFAMAADGELPRWLGAVHPTHKVPHRADARRRRSRRRRSSSPHRPSRRDRLQLLLRPHLLRDRQRLRLDAPAPATSLAATARRRRPGRMRHPRLHPAHRHRRGRRRRPRGRRAHLGNATPTALSKTPATGSNPCSRIKE